MQRSPAGRLARRATSPVAQPICAEAEPSRPILSLDFLNPAIGDDMAAVDRVLRESLRSEVVLIRQVANYIIAGGGKRLRPALLLLAARACG
jgi:octaprenyl-diphosphate synthase